MSNDCDRLAGAVEELATVRCSSLGKCFSWGRAIKQRTHAYMSFQWQLWHQMNEAREGEIK